MILVTSRPNTDLILGKIDDENEMGNSNWKEGFPQKFSASPQHCRTHGALH